MPDELEHFPPSENRVANQRHHLPYKLRKLISETNRGSANDILEAAAFAIERMLAVPKPVTFNDLEKLMRSAVETFRGLEDAAKKVPALNQQVSDLTNQVSTLTQQLTDAQKAAGLAADAQKKAEDALALAQTNTIPAGDIQDGNTLLDSLATPAGTLVDPANIPAANAVAPKVDINDPNGDQ